MYSKVFQGNSKTDVLVQSNSWIDDQKNSESQLGVQLTSTGVHVGIRRHYEQHMPRFTGYNDKGIEVWELVVTYY